jgi:hypothetical protein
VAPIVLLFTDRPAFAQTWTAALRNAGLSARTLTPDGVGEALEQGLGALVDAASEGSARSRRSS